MIKGLHILIIALLLFGSLVMIILTSEGDEEYFGITNNEKWGDLQNKQAIKSFTLFHGYDTYKMMRDSNGKQFYNDNVVNPLDAYILMETINGNTKKVEYREYKKWLFNMERINISYT